MNTTFEMNNARRDADYATNAKLNKKSPVVEVFSAMVNGRDVASVGKVADKAVNYIKDLGARADAGDFSAMAELNSIRRIVISEPVMEQMKLLSVFGTYQNIGFDETVEREVFNHVGEHSRVQANNGDVVFPMVTKETYQVPTFTVSGGYAVDYRRVAMGDMTHENIGMEQVKTDIYNRAMAAIIKKVYDAITGATGVKYAFSGAGLTKTGVDGVLAKVRRFGKPTVIGDYALLSQFTPWAGFVGTVGSNTITGISEAAMNEIANTGLLGMYNGSVLAEMPNPYDLYAAPTAGVDGQMNFPTLAPAGLGFVVPTGGQSPIATYTRGGLTSMTGTDVKSGHNLIRFDLEVGCDVAKGHEYQIGLIHDENLDQI